MNNCRPSDQILIDALLKDQSSNVYTTVKITTWFACISPKKHLFYQSVVVASYCYGISFDLHKTWGLYCSKNEKGELRYELIRKKSIVNQILNQLSGLGQSEVQLCQPRMVISRYWEIAARNFNHTFIL